MNKKLTESPNGLPVIEVDIPSPDSPGFLRRSIKAIGFRDSLQGVDGEQITVDQMMELVDFLADYVSVPEDREEAKDALLDASKNQFVDVLTAFTGSMAEEGAGAVPLASSGDSVDS